MVVVGAVASYSETADYQRFPEFPSSVGLYGVSRRANVHPVADQMHSLDAHPCLLRLFAVIPEVVAHLERALVFSLQRAGPACVQELTPTGSVFSVFSLSPRVDSLRRLLSIIASYGYGYDHGRSLLGRETNVPFHAGIY